MFCHLIVYWVFPADNRHLSFAILRTHGFLTDSCCPLYLLTPSDGIQIVPQHILGPPWSKTMRGSAGFQEEYGESVSIQPLS